MVSDAYINLGISKEKCKLFQEAHFNYYSALVNAQQNLPENRSLEIQDIYDKFLSRQAAFLQRYSMKPLKSNPSMVYSSSTSKPPTVPFIDVVKKNHASGSGLA